MEAINNTNSSAYIIVLLLLYTTIPFSPNAQEYDIPQSSGICLSMVETNGYPCEEHKVTTKDGYILSMLRIPTGRSAGWCTPGYRGTVLLQSGLFMDGVTWLLLPPEQSLAFNLADFGYDVWLVNSRGTKYSTGHTSLSPDDPAYWDWTWDELVAYDLPATIHYVYDQTEQQMHYVGHSLGSLTIMAAISKGQLLNMLRSAALLCPIAYMSHITSPLTRFTAENFVAEELYQLGYYKMEVSSFILEPLKIICRIPNVDCTNLLTLSTGQNCCMKPSIMPTLLDHEPHPSSMKNIIHMSQMIRTGNLTMYDYEDDRENIRHYGQPTPPAYDMTSIPNDFPLFLSYGETDALVDLVDVGLLLDCLKHHDLDTIVVQYVEDYAHGDYVMAENAIDYVYYPLIAFFMSLH